MSFKKYVRKVILKVDTYKNKKKNDSSISDNQLWPVTKRFENFGKELKQVHEPIFTV